MTAAESSAVPFATSIAVTVTELKPRLRGWLHAYAAAISVASGASLIAVAAALRGQRAGWSTAIYAATLTLLFGTSALYHRRPWGPRGHSVMKRLDHSMIFVFIAGTYTPVAVLTLPRVPALAVLAVVWSGALLGVVLRSAWLTAPRWLPVPCYVGLGWVAVFVMPGLLRGAGIVAFTLIIAGGVVYTLGAAVYGAKRPDPFPRVFGFHEVFHACTLVAAVCHYAAIWLVVLS